MLPQIANFPHPGSIAWLRPAPGRDAPEKVRVLQAGDGATVAGPDWLAQIALTARADAVVLDCFTARFGLAAVLLGLLWFLTPAIGASLP